MKYVKDFSFWLMLAINGYLLLLFIKDPHTVNLIILLYWFQSFFMGFFTFLTMLSFKDNSNSPAFFGSKTKQAFFFLFHYSFFHLGLLIFLIATSLINSNVINQYLVTSVWLLLATQAIDFLQTRLFKSNSTINLQQYFFLPYLRVIPLVVLILGFAYFPSSFGLSFLLVKILIDIIMYYLYQRLLETPSNSSD